MNKFDFFCFLKKVLIAAKNAGWEHQPEHDRYICDDVTLCFSQFEDSKEQATMDIEFELCSIDVLRSGVAKFENCHGRKTLKAENIPFPTFDKLFDPKCWIDHGEIVEE